MRPRAPLQLPSCAHQGLAKAAVAMPYPGALPHQRLADPQTASVGPLAGLCSFSIPVRVWQAEEAVANLPLRVAVRVRCGHQVRRGTLGVLIHSRGMPEYSQRT